MGKGSSGGGAGTAPTLAGGRTKVRSAGGVDWVKSAPAIQDGDVAVKVSVEKLDAAWKKDADNYVGAGGAAVHKQPGKYENAKDFLRTTTRPVTMPRVTYDPKTHTASFTDGRHRAAAARDLGKKSIYVTVPRGQAAKVARDLGA